MTRVALLGREDTNWSIDYDRLNTELFLTNLGFSVVDDVVEADLVHAVWWNYAVGMNDPSLKRHLYNLLTNGRLPRREPLADKPVLAVATNEQIGPSNPDFRAAKEIIDLWIAPNTSMVERMTEHGLDVEYQPYYVDERLFRQRTTATRELCADLGIDASHLEGKFVIGSFQRDSLGSNLREQRWEKNPELLVEILRDLPRDDVLLLLAGPRRHWIIDRCEEYDVPYYFYGDEPEFWIDDYPENVQSKRTISKLYNLLDAYLVSSASETGPKAVLEAALSETMILSTEVGMAPDVLDDWCIYEDGDEAVSKLRSMIEGESVAHVVAENYDTAIERASYSSVLQRWDSIYRSWLDRLDA